jgi:hypothetical protein
MFLVQLVVLHIFTYNKAENILIAFYCASAGKNLQAKILLVGKTRM